MKRRLAIVRAAVILAAWPLLQATLDACPICFQTGDAHVAGGVRAAVGVLVTITVGVVAACAAFFGRVIRRQ